MKTVASVLLAVASVVAVHGLDNGLARTPQMGFNSWNHFACNVNQTVMEGAADALVGTGLAGVGYTYLNVDDCWAQSRNASGYVQPEAKTFPQGMAGLAAYAHSKGLKFGLYSDAGTHTCAGRPGSLTHEVEDAASYAEWGVDYLKYDNCYNTGTAPRERYPPMRDALNASGRPILFSMCEWGVEQPTYWAPRVGNSWRTTPDIKDFWLSMMFNLQLTEPSYLFAGPGGWNDPDMLEVGNGGMSTVEYTAHFSLWSLLKAPLLIGCDLNAMSDATLGILNNTEIIALNQDALGVAGHRVASAGDLSTVVEGAQGLELAPGLGGYLESTNAIIAPCAGAAAPAAPGLTGPAWGKAWYAATAGRRAVSGGVTAAGVAPTQAWSMGADGKITSVGAEGKCLSVDHCATWDWGDNVSASPCDGHKDEGDDTAASSCGDEGLTWKYNPSTGAVVAGNNGQCLTASDIASTPALGVRNAITLPCAPGTPGQAWKWNAADGTLQLADGPGQCLTVFTDVPPAERNVYAGPLADGSVGVVLYNIALSPRNVTLSFTDVGFTSQESVAVRDLQAGVDVGSFTDSYTAVVPGHGAATLRVSRK